MKKLLALLALSLSALAHATAIDWPLSYEGKSSNAFIWVDTQTGLGLGADIIDGELRLGSNSLSAPAH